MSAMLSSVTFIQKKPHKLLQTDVFILFAFETCNAYRNIKSNHRKRKESRNINTLGKIKGKYETRKLY